MELFCIYALVADDDDGVFRYVGKTKIGCIDRRIRQHITSVNRRHTPKNSWIKSVIARGSTIKAVIIEVCDSDVWEEREKYWIAHYRLIAPLTNVSDGGDTGPNMTGYRHSDEAKALIAKSSLGRKPSVESLAKRSKSLKGRVMSRKWIEKIRLTRIKNHRNGDTSWRNGVIAAAKAATGTKYSPERIEKAAAGQRGKPKSTNVLMGCRKPVVCVETGTWFASTAEASYRCGIGRTSITNALKTGGKSSGFRWAFGERKPLV